MVRLSYPFSCFCYSFCFIDTHTKKKKIDSEKNWNIKSPLEFHPPPPHSLLVYLNWGVSFPPFCSISCLKYLQIDISSSPTTSCAFFVCAAFVILSLAKKRKTKMWNLLTFLFLLFIVGFFSLRLSPPPHHHLSGFIHFSPLISFFLLSYIPLIFSLSSVNTGCPQFLSPGS